MNVGVMWQKNTKNPLQESGGTTAALVTRWPG